MSAIESFEGSQSHSFYPIELCPPYVNTVEKLAGFAHRNQDVVQRIRLHFFTSTQVDRFNLTAGNPQLSPKNQVSLKRFQRHVKEWKVHPIESEKPALPVFWLFILLTNDYQFQSIPQLAGPRSLRVVPANRINPTANELEKTQDLQQLIWVLYSISACSLGEPYIADDLKQPDQPCEHAASCPVRSLGRNINPR